MPAHTGTRPQAGRTERAALVGLTSGGAQRAAAERSLDELAGLATAAGAEVALRMLQERDRPHPATFLGSGKVETLKAAAETLDADLVIFDNELSPAQLRNLERALERRVVDRTQLILDIFALRARTREGHLQVELAQLKYLLPRLVGQGTALSRLGGGIGTRGPGETKLESDRRRIRERIDRLTRDLGAVGARRARLRDRRRETTAPSVALVGYTNAGKTTLFNRLTHAEAVVSDALFVTLDPLVRQVRLADGPVLLVSDTVGFIDRLPHTLVAAFRATLEEVVEADLLLHVVDATSDERDRQIEAVERVLAEVGASEVPRFLVLNKVDGLDEGGRQGLRARFPDAWQVSARTGEGLEPLLDAVALRLGLDVHQVQFEFDEASAHDQARVARAYRVGRVVSHQTQDGRGSIEVRVARRYADRLREGRRSEQG